MGYPDSSKISSGFLVKKGSLLDGRLAVSLLLPNPVQRKRLGHGWPHPRTRLRTRSIDLRGQLQE